MTWDVVQQLIRIAMQIVGSALVSLGFALPEHSALLSAAALNIGAFAWWALVERGKALPK